MPRGLQQLGGLFIALVGAGGTGWVWYVAQTDRTFDVKEAVLLPALFILGLGLVLFPNPKAERIARGESIAGLSESELETPRWRGIMIAAIIAGFVNLFTVVALLHRPERPSPKPPTSPATGRASPHR